MHDPLSIEAPYDALTFIDQLKAYDTNFMTDQMLDLVRDIQQAEAYYWVGLCLPIGDNTTLGANATLNGTIQVPEGTYVYAITHYDTVEDEARGAVGFPGRGFKLKIWDKGSKASIFYPDYAMTRNVSSNMELHYGQGSNFPPSDPGSNADNPFGMNYLLSPFIINKPGVLGWEVVNMDPVSIQCQVMLSCAVPINRQSTGQRRVDRSY